QTGEHLVEAFAVEGEAHQAGLGGGQQQLTERAGHGAVGDVEKCCLAGPLRQLSAQYLQVSAVVGTVECFGEAHGMSLEIVRSLAIPSAPARRAAAGVQPSRSATSG